MMRFVVALKHGPAMFVGILEPRQTDDGPGG